MTMRRIIRVEHRDRSSVIRLDCGHERSIGGHVMHNGQPVDRVRMINQQYDCQDSYCYSGSAEQ